jgi:hypothetical protein
MKERLHIIRELARRYERTQAGRVGVGERDLLVDYEGFLADAGCADGEARLTAERELADAARAGVLTLVPHRRDLRLIQQIRFNLAREAALFSLLAEPSPTQRRNELARQFAEAAKFTVPSEWTEAWSTLCSRLEIAARRGDSILPFSRDSLSTNSEILALVPKLLAWRGDSLMRVASCVLCGRSKRLEALSSKLGQVLDQLTTGTIRSLEDVGILANPRFVLLHGPIRLRLDGEWLDLRILAGPFRLSEHDVTRAAAVETAASRCLTVENETTFHELVKLHCGELLIQTSFPGSGTMALLRRLPAHLEFWHFGDTDPEGFEILRDLRERSGRPFRALHMHYRASLESSRITAEERRKIERLMASSLMASEFAELKGILAAGREGIVEQESLGQPAFQSWPFYGSREAGK